MNARYRSLYFLLEFLLFLVTCNFVLHFPHLLAYVLDVRYFLNHLLEFFVVVYILVVRVVLQSLDEVVSLVEVEGNWFLGQLLNVVGKGELAAESEFKLAL